jgi:NAD(P)H-hydrate epimerase
MKGAATVVASPDGRLSVNGSGNPALATAGSGDVLSGIIGTFSVSMDLYKAAVTGVFIHGKCGDLAASELGESSVIASDLIQYLPKVLTGTQ